MELARIFDGKKFMWDGKEYLDETIAQNVAKKYKTDGFETQVIEEGGKFFAFTRRVVKEIVIEGQ